MASLIGRVVISSFALHSFTRPGCPPFRCSERTIARSMSSGSTQRIFQLKLDPLTGNSEWIVVEEGENAENSTEIPLWSTSYLDMLNDTRRNRAFRRAIEKAITKPCHVLDIGAGTGLLSMMAARAMDASGANGCASTKGRVSACESYLPMVKMMRKVLRINGMEKNIHVFHKRSDELKVGVELASRADILVSEILDSELLGEGLIPTLQHAHDMLLVENPCTIPYRATTYGQLVESPFLWKLHDLSSYEAKAFDSVHLAPAGLETVMCVKPQQYAMHCDAISEEIKLLSEPFKIFDIEFWKRPESHGETKLHIKITDDGRVHAVVSWWILQLDSEGTIFYSTAPKWISLPFEGGLQMQGPGDVDWCDHWKQCVWFIPGKGISVSKDEQVHFQAVHDDTSISYSLKKEYPAKSPGHYGHCTRDFSLMLSQERVAIYGDREWRSTISRAARSALQKKVSSLCVVADDSVFLTILVASLSKNLQVISLFPGLQENGTQYLQAVGDANGFSTDRVRVIDKRKTCLNLNFTGQKKIDLLVGEPFYYGNDGMLPWQNLRFWKERSMLDSVLAEDVLIMPCKGILKACAISLPDLWKSRRSLKMVEGFDHSIVNASLGACGELPDQQEGPCLPYFIWQCGQVKILSETCAVMEFDLLKSLSPCFGHSKLGFTKPGICHGFALWIDWVMDAKNSIVLSTGPDQRYWKQGVKLLSKPIAVGARGSCREGESCSAVIDASFSPSNGELNINHAFT